MIDKARRARARRRATRGTSASSRCPAFIGVGVVLFAIWGTMIFFLNKWGQDASDETTREGRPQRWRSSKNLSGPGLIIFAITITAAATQWVMSLEPGWASTMFPVIFAVNQFLTCFAFCVALFLLLVEPAAVQGRDAAEVPARHGHADAGVHPVLVVHLVLPVHAGVDREPAGRDPVLPEAVEPRRAGGTCRRR